MEPLSGTLGQRMRFDEIYSNDEDGSLWAAFLQGAEDYREHESVTALRADLMAKALEKDPQAMSLGVRIQELGESIEDVNAGVRLGVIAGYYGRFDAQSDRALRRLCVEFGLFLQALGVDDQDILQQEDE